MQTEGFDLPDQGGKRSVGQDSSPAPAKASFNYSNILQQLVGVAVGARAGSPSRAARVSCRRCQTWVSFRRYDS